MEHGRPILGRSTSQANAPGGGGGSSAAATVISPQSDLLNEVLQQQCTVTPSNSSDEIQDGNQLQAAITSSSTGTGSQQASWNIQASEFVPGKSRSQEVAPAAPVATSIGTAELNNDPSTESNAVAVSGANEDTMNFLCQLNSALDRLTSSPGSFNEEKVNIISIYEHYATAENVVVSGVDMIVQYAIGYRPFTYDAATLCQQIALSFTRKFGTKGSTFRDLLLKALHLEHQNLDKYLQEGAKDHSSAGKTSDTDETWSPASYRNYINGLVQFTGFLFMNLVGDKSGQRLPVIGKAVRTSLLKLLQAVEVDYLDTILIVLKECGRALTEVSDASKQWSEILEALDKLLANSVPASLLSDPNEKQAPLSNGDTPRLRISSPLRNQLRRFLEQARSWGPTPSTALDHSDASKNAATAATAEFELGCFEFDPDSVDPSYIEMLPTGVDSISASSAGGEQDDDEVVKAYEEFAADQPTTTDDDQHLTHADGAPQRSEVPDEDYDAELDSFLATIPKDETNSKPDAGNVENS